MRARTGLITGLLLLAGAMPGLAQRAGTVEIGAFGRFTKFESKLNFDDRLGVGGRLGIFVVQNLAVEGDVTYTRTKSQAGDELRHTPLHARLIYNIPVGEKAAVLVGAGYVRNLFRASYRETESGFGGLVGVRYGLGSLLALRVDGTADYIPNAESRFVTPPQVAGVEYKKSNLHLGGEAGLSLLLGGRRDGDSDGDGVKNSLDSCPKTPAGDRVDDKGCSLPKDADGDGVADASDRCPNTPAGTAVDASGCPKDSDGDGVADASDKCPNTPAGAAVDAAGCPKDSDGDGVADASDKCPNTPAGTAVDAAGCPKDSDGDGVTDDLDQCPSTAAGVSVDAKGCPSAFQKGESLILKGVNFQTGKAVLLPASQGTLDQVAQSLIDNPDVNVEVAGHTDNLGSDAANLRLSQARAEAVRQYLIGKGVPADRMTAKGYGESNPVANNATAAGRAANRRVELSRTN